MLFIRDVAEGNRYGDLEVEPDGREGVAGQRREAQRLDDGWRVGVEATLGTVVAQRYADVHPETPVSQLFRPTPQQRISLCSENYPQLLTYGLFEAGLADLLLLLPLHRVVHQDPRLQDVQLALAKNVNTGQERTARLFERVRQEEAQHEAAEDGKQAHQHKQPEPARLATNAAHVQDAKSEEARRGLAALHAGEKEHDTRGRLGARVPGRQSPQGAGNEAGFAEAEQETCRDEGAVAVLPGLQRAHGAKQKKLQREPAAGPDAVQSHVGRDFEEHDAQGEQLLPEVELVLREADIVTEVIREGAGDVASV